jgi:hypothetical protein
MLTPKAIKTSRRFALATGTAVGTGAAEDSRPFETSLTLIDFHPYCCFSPRSRLLQRRFFGRILANGGIVFCYVR